MACVFVLVYFLQLSKRNSIEKIGEVKYDQTDVFQNSGGNINTFKTDQPQKLNDKLPTSYLLSVPFASQAPLGNWSEPYQNACEEASIIMAEHYLNDSSLSKEQMKEEIDKSVVWQLDLWKEHVDLDAQTTLLLAKQYFNLDGQIVVGNNADNVKKYIASGVPVIAPTAGRKLGNPNFTGSGPEYHMLVIIGYDDSQGIFITNDPGTRKGEKYIYKYQTLIDAISGPHENMEKELVVLSK